MGRSAPSKLMKTKTKVILLLFEVACITHTSLGQGTVQITFDGPPAIAPGTSKVVTNYFESGMLFKSSSSYGYGFGRTGPPTDTNWPNNGTAFIQPGLGSFLFSFTNGSTFDMISVDLAGYSSVVPDGTVQIVGYRPDNSTVQTNFSVSNLV